MFKVIKQLSAGIRFVSENTPSTRDCFLFACISLYDLENKYVEKKKLQILYTMRKIEVHFFAQKGQCLQPLTSKLQ